MGAEPNIVLVCRTGGRYDEYDVQRLYNNAVEHIGNGPFGRFVVLTDAKINADSLGIYRRHIKIVPLLHPWRGWWAKMEMFDPVFVAQYAPFLYIDLDTIVVGDLSDLLAPKAGFTMLRDFHHPERDGASGVMYFGADFDPTNIWIDFCRFPNQHIAFYFRGGDQAFITYLRKPDNLFQDILPGQVVSFKPTRETTLRSVPENARLVCFHGDPTIDQAKGTHQWIREVLQPSRANIDC